MTLKVKPNMGSIKKLKIEVLKSEYLNVIKYLISRQGMHYLC